MRSTVVFAVVILLQGAMAKSIAEDKPDEFVKEAADAIDSTLLSFRESFFDFINDSTKVNDLIQHMSNSIGKHAPRSDNQTQIQEGVHESLRQLTDRANRTLFERFPDTN